MNIEDVKARLADIKACRRDDEAAHAKEDALYADVMDAILESAERSWDSDDVVEWLGMLEEARKTEDIEFSRWCA